MISDTSKILCLKYVPRFLVMTFLVRASLDTFTARSAMWGHKLARIFN